MNQSKKKSISLVERLEDLKKDFIKTIPQLMDIEEAQKTHREIQQKKSEEQFLFINTQASATV